MKRIVAVLLALSVVGSPMAQDSPMRLSLHGSNTVGQKLAPALAIAWAQAEGWEVVADTTPSENERRIDVRRDAEQGSIEISAHGTSTGLSALAEGSADLWMASRSVLADEVAIHTAALGKLDEPAQEHVIALDGLAIIVHPGNRVPALSTDQIRAIFQGKISDWSAVGQPVGAIRLYARDDKSGTFDTFKSLVLRGEGMSPRTQRFESTDALSAAVAADRNGIGFVGLAGVGHSRPVAVSGTQTRPMLPAALSIATEDYLLSRRLMLYSTRASSEQARRFIEFVQSADGQALVDHVGFVGQGMRLQADAVGADTPEPYRELTSGAQRLSVNLRFGNGRSYLDSKAMRDLDRIAAFLRQYPRGAQEITLIGFSDRREHNPVLAQHMSNDRADFVAAELAHRGVPVHRSRGFGQQLAVADNETDAGRSKNRRVEIWLRARAPEDSKRIARASAADAVPHSGG